MLFRVHTFYVHEHGVEEAGRGQHGFGGDVAAGFNVGVHSRLSGQAENSEGECWLVQGLASAKSHASSRTHVEYLILKNPAEDFSCGNGFAVDSQTSTWAGSRTEACRFRTAYLPIHHRGAICEADGPLGAHFFAGAAVQAVLFGVGKLLKAVLGLRIAAPTATEGTPFEKDERPYPLAVMDGKLLYIEDGSARLFVGHHAAPKSLCALREMMSFCNAVESSTK